MIEILFVVFLFGKLKNKALRKNRSKHLAWLLPLFWFGGEFMAGVFGAIIYTILGKPIDNSIDLYGYALLGGVIGGGISFLIVQLLPAIKLNCPKCGKEYSASNTWWADCKGCNARLEVINGKVVLKEKA